MPRIWITRSLPFGRETQARLAAKGYEAVAAPLLTLRRLDVPDLPLKDEHLIFTSRHGIEALAALTAARHWPCICVGAASAREARRAGFTQVHAAGGTARDVIAWVQANWPEAANILHISGRHHRGDIIETLMAAGYKQARREVYYDMIPVRRDPRAQPRPDDDVWLYSPRGAAALAALGLDTRHMRFISLSADIDAALGDIACQARIIAEKPNELSLFAHLPSV